MNKAYKYRLYPTNEQATMFAKTFGCCRKVYNLMLEEKIDNYKRTGKFGTVTPAKYKKEYPYLKEVDSLALAKISRLICRMRSKKSVRQIAQKRKADSLISNQQSIAVSRILRTIKEER